MAILLVAANLEHGFAEKLRDGRLSYSDLSENAQKIIPRLHVQAGEDYRTVELETGEHAFDVARLKIGSGAIVEVTFEEAAALALNKRD